MSQQNTKREKGKRKEGRKRGSKGIRTSLSGDTQGGLYFVIRS